MLNYKDFINESTAENWVFKGDFSMSKDMVNNGKLIKKFIPNEVTGKFTCVLMDLTSLEGCPNVIKKGFLCQSNELISLTGGPNLVGLEYNCSDNKLTNLIGAPLEINDTLYAHYNKLTSLEGCPDTMGHHFYCNSNEQLNSLEYGPKYIHKKYGVDRKLKLESIFVKSGSYKNDYWTDLLMYMIKENINIEEVKGWPEGFLNSNLGRSAKSIRKFNI